MASRKQPGKVSRKYATERGHVVGSTPHEMSNRKGAIDYDVLPNGANRRRRRDDNFILSPHQPLGAALLNSAIGVAVTDGEGRFLLVNEVFCRMIGYNERELLVRDWSSITHTDGKRQDAGSWQMSPDQPPSSILVERRCIRKNGTDIWVRTSVSRLQESSTRVLLIALIEDITERKQAEQALAEKDSELKAARRLGQTASWQWKPSTDTVIWSDELYRATGRDPKLGPPTFQEHSTLFSAESWNRLIRHARETLRTGAPCALELEVIRPDGTRGWVKLRGETVRNARSRIVGLRGTVQDVTTRKRAEEALLKSEEKFTKAFNAVPVAVTLTTLADGRQIAVNQALLRMTGYTRDEVIGHTSLELGYWDDPSDRQKLVERLLAGEHLQNVECCFRRKNREPFTGLLSAELIELDGEQCIVTATMDISDLRRAERSVRALQSKLALHFQQTMFGVMEVDSDFHVIEWNPAAETIFGYSRQEAIGRDTRDLITPGAPGAELSAMFEKAVHEGGCSCSINRNTTKDGKEIICEWFNTPLVQEDGTISGIMSLVRDVTAEKQTQADLAASEATLCAIFQSTDDAIWTVDATRFGLMTFNTAAAERFASGNSRELRTGMTPDDLLSPKEAKWWKDSYQQVLTSGAFKTDYEVKGKSAIFHLSFNPLFRDGKIFGISVFARNVTKRREAEQALRASEERYRQLVWSSNDWVWEIDANGRYKYAGPQCREILGYAPEELIGRTPFDLMPPGEAERVAALFHAIAAERKPFRALENANLHKDGHLVVLETNGVPIIDAQGRFCGYGGMDRDITARKEAEEALRESERRLRLALESGRMYAFEWHPGSDMMRRSAECAVVLGVPEYSPLDTGREFLNRLHPSDRSNYIDVLTHLTPAQDTYRTEYRKTLPDGKMRWMEARGRGFFDSDGNLVRVVGIAADITARKESEDALRTLSACLINAQEEERKRLARELHDGVSQALAVISIGMSQAAKATREAQHRSKLEKLYSRLQGVLSDIGHLSHELHPSTLKHLGLPAAIRVLCDEIAHTYAIDVGFTDRSAPQRVSANTALCLYRVAQEGLQNIVKHSRSKQAWVQLGGDQDEISLHIWDQGVGFDPYSTNSGLGLVSMRERLRLVGGRILITSSRGSGTRIDAYAPLERQEYQAAA